MADEFLTVDEVIPATEVAAEEAAATGAAITAPEFFGPLIVLGLLYSMMAWFRPQQKAQIGQRHNWLWKVITYVPSKIVHAIKHVEAQVAHAMSHWLAPKTAHIAHWLRTETHQIHALTQVTADLADNTHEALTWLRHQVVPELIRKATIGLAQAIAALGARLQALEQRLQAAADSVADILATIGVDAVHTVLGALSALAAEFVALYNLVHTNILVAVEALREGALAVQQALQSAGITVADGVAPALAGLGAATAALWEEVYTDLKPRLVKVEELLAPAAFAAAVIAVVAKAFEYLTCRNVKTAAGEVCAMDETLMDNLLFMLGGAFLLLSLEEYTRMMQGLVHETTTLAADLLQV